ncbi:C40 family peptidase [Candidatus Kinetoplastidibacterium galati]|uniref:NlpC/P60 family cell wall-associated hydrolase n=1 Tax=Candidatus Kinetoplastidibacterium galati TCC219 TaxID=1208921 RepID=M1LYK2_9PROT|nr:C40 family peptidase [Candidatus Kinetoplastibacterium galatii]AGF49151.1 NlpC/P60 family cell wall-associated hydrolase [Candidatus Kinetoplastibacterium galatii TCC219]
MKNIEINNNLKLDIKIAKLILNILSTIAIVFLLSIVTGCSTLDGRNKTKQYYNRILDQKELHSTVKNSLKKSIIKNKIKKLYSFVNEALNNLGKPYNFGGKNPRDGFDCSGLIHYCAKKALNINLPRTSKKIAAMSTPVNRKKLQTGDLLFFNINRNRYSHVGIYLCDDFFIHSPGTGKHVEISSLKKIYWSKKFIAAHRIIK